MKHLKINESLTDKACKIFLKLIFLTEKTTLLNLNTLRILLDIVQLSEVLGNYFKNLIHSDLNFIISWFFIKCGYIKDFCLPLIV